MSADDGQKGLSPREQYNRKKRAQMDPNFHTFTKYLLPAGTDLLDVKRRALYKYAIFSEMGYTPHPGQVQFHDCIPHIETVTTKVGSNPDCPHIQVTERVNLRDPTNRKKICVSCKAEIGQIFHNRFRVVVAGARYGKSLSIGKEAIVQGGLLWPGIDSDGNINTTKSPRVIIYAPSYAIGQFEFNEIIWGMESLGLPPTQKYQNNPDQGNMIAQWEWGSEVVVKSWDNPKSLLGAEADLAVLCESASLSVKRIWERYIRQRLGSRLGTMITGSTPSGPGEFIETFLRRGQDPNDKVVMSWQFPTHMNPHHDPEELAEAERDMDPDTYNEQVLGLITSMVGLVYKPFKTDIHAIKQLHPNDIPETAQNVGAIDWGWKAPMAVDLGYWDKQRKLHICWEKQASYKTVDEFCDGYTDPITGEFFEGLAYYLRLYKTEWLVYDNADPGKAYSLINNELIAALIEEGTLKIIPCKKNEMMGINKVRELLKVQGNGEPWFEIDPSCAAGIREFGKNEFKNDNTELRKPGNDHSLNCIEYISITDYALAYQTIQEVNRKHRPHDYNHQRPLALALDSGRILQKEREEEMAELESGDYEEDEWSIFDG